MKAFAVIMASTAAILDLIVAVPVDDAATIQARHVEYLLRCGKFSYVNHKECWRRYRTHCTNNGYVENEVWFTERGARLCNRDVCYCMRNPTAPLPGFFADHGGYLALTPVEEDASASSTLVEVTASNSAA